ncbi:MAG: hypothetical protein M3Y82_07010, partial [Verrucomicrobiota bacterium]|nr:hypothetical protein [Verrucomicrobiota bacterium]
YVAGVLDFASMSTGLDSLLEMPDFKIGDRVCTLKGSAHGVVKKILHDGRISWQRDGSAIELIALPESLLREPKSKSKSK